MQNIGPWKWTVHAASAATLAFVAVSAGALTLDEFRALPDNRVAVRTSLGVRSVKATSAAQVEVQLGLSSTPTVENAKAWRVVSDDDPDYAFAKFVTPAKSVVKKLVEVEAPEGCAFRRFEKRVATLDLPVPMKDGRTYDFIAQGVDGAVCVGGHTAASLVYGRPAAAPDPTVDLATLGLRRVEPVGNGVLLLEFGPDFAAAAGSKQTSYAIILNGQPAKVINLGRITRVDTYVPSGWPFQAIPMHELFLQIQPAFKDGDRIEVKVDKVVTTGADSATVTFNATATLSNSIKVNQIGYLTDSPVKMAYLGRWLGSFPEFRISDDGQQEGTINVESEFWTDLTKSKSQSQQDPGAKTADIPAAAAAAPVAADMPPVMGPGLAFAAPPAFHILPEAGGAPVFTGTAKLVHRAGAPDGGVYKVDHSGENVYHLDFTAFKTPGRYFISVAGVGRSLPFAIADDLYKTAFEVQAHGVFTQRCGIELKPPFSDWRRIACHDKGLILTSQVKSDKHAIDELPAKTVYRPAGAVADPVMDALDKDPALAARYLFNGDFKDSSGHGLDLTPAVTAPKFSAADTTVFAGGKVYGPSVDGADNGGKGTIKIEIAKGLCVAFWFRKDGKPKFESFFKLGEAPANRFQLIAGWGVPILVASKEQGNGPMPRFGRPSDGKWHHITAVLDPADATPRKITVYDNGTEVAGEVVGAMDPLIEGPLRVANINGDEAEGAYYADFRIYSRTLSPAEIKALATPRPAAAPVTIQASGGHHDAGDYNPRSHLDVAQKLMDAYEMAPQKFYDGQLNIPEKGNGLPDILDEAAWAWRLWLGLQDADGGVRNGTESNGDPNFIQTVELDVKGDYAYAKDAEGSLLFAGAMAQASRLWQANGKAAEAADFRQRAVKAYEWAMQHPQTTTDKAFYGYHIAPSRAYAAAQLLHTTKDPKYHEAFAGVAVWSKKPDADVEDYGKYDMRDAAAAYAVCPDDVVDTALRANVRKAIIAKADVFIRLSSPMAYAFIRHPWAPISWGTGAYENWLNQVAQAYALTRDPRYKEWLIRTCDNTLGANPLNRSYIVGLGTRTVRAPLHNSRYGQTGEVCPGQQVQGPVQRGDSYQVKETACPPVREDFAVLYTFVDNHFAIGMDEGTINSQAQSMAIFGLLLPDHP